MTHRHRSTRLAILIALLIAIAGIATVALSGTVAAQSETDIRWDETTVASSGTPWTQSIIIAPTDDPITFGANTGRSLRIQNLDTGEAIKLTPTNTTTYEVTRFKMNFDNFVSYPASDDREITNSDSPYMFIRTEQRKYNEYENGSIKFQPGYPINIDGDPKSFFEQTFYRYNVQLLSSDGTVLGETDESKIKATGYEVSYKYDGSTLAVERDPSVQSDWHVVLRQDFEQIDVAENNAENENFLFDTEDSQFNVNKSFGVIMYPDETQTDAEDVILGFNLFRTDEIDFVDGPIGDDTSDPNQDESDDSDSDDSGSDESDDGANQNPDESDGDGSTEDGSSSADISISSRPTSVAPGDSATVQFSVTNTGENASAGGIQFDTPAGITAENVFFTGGIESGETITRVVSIGTNENMQTDTYTITADASVGTRTDTVSFDLTVGEDDGLSRFDQTGSGTIDFPDVIAAIEANNEGTEIGGQPVSFTDVINIIQANNQGTTV